MMKLNAQQEELVREWIASGLQIQDIQKKLREEFSMEMTYMECRFLIDDLNLEPVDLKAKSAREAEEKESEKPSPDDGIVDFSDDDVEGALRLTVEPVTRPGALVSGQVTFSDGEKAEWFLDQVSGLGLKPSTPGYQPPEQDIPEFQRQLAEQLRKMGYA